MKEFHHINTHIENSVHSRASEFDQINDIPLAVVLGHELPADHLRPDVTFPPLMKVSDAMFEKR